MKDHINNILNKMDQISKKIKDNDYKYILDQLKKIYDYEDKKITNTIYNMDLRIKELERENAYLHGNNLDKQRIIDYILDQEQNKELKEKYDSVENK
tara:strand:- start:580 stop:870 length:291 start_codon:yes stop_codon:yes gene_type:complete